MPTAMLGPGHKNCGNFSLDLEGLGAQGLSFVSYNPPSITF